MDELLLFLKKDSDPAMSWSRMRPRERQIEIPENEGITLEFRGHQAHRVEVAHFKCVGEVDVLKKARTVSDYAVDLILVEGGKVLFPLEQGLVVFCGNDAHAELLEEKDVTRSTFLPLRPLSPSQGESSQPAIPLDASSLAILRCFLEQLRKSLPASGT